MKTFLYIKRQIWDMNLKRTFIASSYVYHDSSKNKFDERYPDILTHFVEQQQAILVNENDGDGIEY